MQRSSAKLIAASRRIPLLRILRGETSITSIPLLVPTRNAAESRAVAFAVATC